MLIRRRAQLLLFVLAFACAQGWNRWNISAMRQTADAAAHVRPGGAVITPDDASYLQEVERLLGNRPDLEQGHTAHRPVLRPPGYGLWYMAARLVLPPDAAITAVVLLQCLLFALSVALLHAALIAQGIPAVVRWPLLLTLAVWPIFHGFLFYTISEGVTPALTLLVLSAALLAHAGQRGWLWAGCALWSLLLLTRPVLAWAGLALLPLLWSRWRSPVRVALVLVLCAAPTLAWWGANVLRAGRWVSLHPVHQPDELGINRLPHAAFWELAKSWGARGGDFHFVMETAFRAALSGDSTSAQAERFLALAPGGMLSEPERAAIAGAFGDWERFTREQLAPSIARGERTLACAPEERLLIARLDTITGAWRSAHAFHHHVAVPLRVLKDLVAHSNLNLWLFQHHLRGLPWMEALRWASALLHVSLMLSVLLAALLRVQAPVRGMAIGAVAYLLFLAYVQRGVEERYTLPVLFIGVACAAFVVRRKAPKAQRTH
jgi:hypothetical protein